MVEFFVFGFGGGGIGIFFLIIGVMCLFVDFVMIFFLLIVNFNIKVINV